MLDSNGNKNANVSPIGSGSDDEFDAASAEVLANAS